MVRPRSATPLSAGSNPAVTSKTKSRSLWSGFLFWRSGLALSPLFEALCAEKTGSHTPLGDRKARFPGGECGYLRQRRIPGCFLLKGHSLWVSFIFSLAVMALDLNSVPQRYAQGMPVHICRAERVKLACKRQACISAEGIPGLYSQQALPLDTMWISW